MADEVTQLPPGQEQAFQLWLQRNHVRDLDNPESHYDYRGAFLAGAGRSGNAHFPDTFKQHGHPTFSVESRYSSGPDDGGHWNGETYVPQARAVTDAGPRSLSAPYGMTPGVRAVLPGINDQQPAAPYGMEPRQRHVIPDQVNLDAPPAPEAVNLDTPTQKPIPEPTHTGWEVKDPAGRTVMHMPLNPMASKAYQGYQVTQAGKSLLEQAVTPAEKEAANRALAWGMSRIGTAPVEEVTKELVHRYDTDMGNSTKVQLQDMRTRNRGGGGKGGPVGPSKAAKFDDQTNKEDAEFEEKIVNNEETKNKLAAMGEMQRDLDRMDTLMASGRGLQQRVAQQEELKQLTGKVSRESEQLVITGGAGLWNNLANRLALYTDENPSLTSAYTQEFRNMIASSRNKLKQQRASMGDAAGQRLVNSERFVGSDEKTKGRLKRYGRGAITGEWDDPKAAGGKVDEDLLK